MKQLKQKELKDSIGKLVYMRWKYTDSDEYFSWMGVLENVDEIEDPESTYMSGITLILDRTVFIDDEILTPDETNDGVCDAQDEVYILDEDDELYKSYTNFLNNLK